MLVAVVSPFVGIKLAAANVVPFAVDFAGVAAVIQFVAAVARFAAAKSLVPYLIQLGVVQFVDITDSAAVVVETVVVVVVLIAVVKVFVVVAVVVVDVQDCVVAAAALVAAE